MITVVVSRSIPGQTLENRVKLYGFDRLTPKAARAALEVAFGGSSGGGVVLWTPDDNPDLEYGYRVYENTARKIYPETYGA